jgi:hypothetical protein
MQSVCNNILIVYKHEQMQVSLTWRNWKPYVYIFIKFSLNQIALSVAVAKQLLWECFAGWRLPRERPL